MLTETVVGVDVGGTYTDLFLYDAVNQSCRVVKVVTDHDAQAEGVERGLKSFKGSLGNLGSMIHGTTVGTNALLQRTGARVGLITTKGFRDVLEMRRRDRPHTWGLWGHFDPIVPRYCRKEVQERTLADGTVMDAVNPSEIKSVARALLEQAWNQWLYFLSILTLTVKMRTGRLKS